MSKKYKQLGLERRYQMEALLKTGMSQKNIALQLGVHPSTVCRELQRNVARRGRTAGAYIATQAQQKTATRHHSKPKQIKFTIGMKQLIVHYLSVERWSPELISKKASFKQNAMVSHERIYQWIWECKHSNSKQHLPYKYLYQYLKHGKRRRKRGARNDNRGIILHRIPLTERPAIVTQRSRLGDIEVDLMVGKNHKGALLVMTDRASLHTRLQKVNSKHSNEVGDAIIDCLLRNDYHPLTLTFDNDKAFACHTDVKNKTKADTFFTRPYTSQDKGTVENRIGVIRRFFPKKTDLTSLTDELINDVEAKLNNRPVRKFNYLTPNQILQQKIALIS